MRIGPDKYQGSGRGKEAGPALNPLKGSSAFLPSDGTAHGTLETKVKVLKRNVVGEAARVKNSLPLVNFSARRERGQEPTVFARQTIPEDESHRGDRNSAPYAKSVANERQCPSRPLQKLDRGA